MVLAVGPAGLPALVEAIRHMHGAEATYVESVAVREEHAGAVVWDGEVQVGAYLERTLARPAVQRAFAREELLRPWV